MSGKQKESITRAELKRCMSIESIILLLYTTFKNIDDIAGIVAVVPAFFRSCIFSASARGAVTTDAS